MLKNGLEGTELFNCNGKQGGWTTVTGQSHLPSGSVDQQITFIEGTLQSLTVLFLKLWFFRI